MRSPKSDQRGLDPGGEQLLRELDLLQAREPVPGIEPPQLIDQAVRNMARRELPNPPAAPLAGSIRWIAGLATVSIALIVVGISMVQSPPYIPPPSAPALKTEQQFESAPEPRAKSRLAKEIGAEQALSAASADADVAEAAETSAMDEAPVESAQAWLDQIRQLYDQGLLTEAAVQLRAFRADYPEYPLPDWAAELPR